MAPNKKSSNQSRKVSARAIKRYSRGNERTNNLVRSRKEAWKSSAAILPVPGFMEPAAPKMLWCQLHAINNCVGESLVTVEALEKARLAEEEPAKGGPKGLWDREFFFRTLRQQFGLIVTRSRIGVNGTHAQFMEKLNRKHPDWKNLRWIAYLDYDTKHNLASTDRQGVSHAVALRDGLVYDADHADRVFALADYPLRDTIAALYIVTRVNP